jgi:DNA gyrase subunit A
VDAEQRQGLAERLEILAGMHEVLSKRGQFLAIVGASADPAEAREEVMRAFRLTDIQATAVLDLQARRLTVAERDRIAAELAEIRSKLNAADLAAGI